MIDLASAPPTLIACSHGTASEVGQAAIRSIVEGARELLADVSVRETYVDVQYPQIDEVTAAVHAETDSPRAVIVPLLLSTGYHTKVDIARAVDASGGRTTATATLGPHPLLVDILEDRLRDVGADPDADTIVLAAAGSSDPQSSAHVRETADMLRAQGGWRVVCGFAASASPTIVEAVAQARADGHGRVIAASYVLAPGHFANVVARAGADITTGPLAPDPRLAAIVAERYREAVIRPHNRDAADESGR